MYSLVMRNLSKRICLSLFATKSVSFCKKSLFHFQASECYLERIFYFDFRSRCRPWAQGLRPWPQGLGPPGPRAWRTKPQVSLKRIKDLPCALAGSCLMCRGFVFCARVKSSVQFQTPLCSSKVFRAVVKPSVQFQSLPCSSLKPSVQF